MKKLFEKFALSKWTCFAVLFGSFFIFSCNKHNDELVQPQNASKPEKQDIAHFDESNASKLTWDQLPAELKNAIPLKSTDPIPLKSIEKSKNASASGKLSADASHYTNSIGPWGGSGGSPFYIYPPSGYYRIYAMAIRSGTYVNAIAVWYASPGGTIYYQGAGSNGGTYFLHYFSSDEYIYAVGGRAGRYLDRLDIYTNKKKFSHGGTGGSSFYKAVGIPRDLFWDDYKILGFYGRSGSLIDQIGCYVYTRF